MDEDEFPWSRACVKREEQIKLWGNDGSNLRNVLLKAHIGCVDAVHLFNVSFISCYWVIDLEIN